MGSLSNLYISQSYQSLAHLGTNNALSAGTMTLLQDGIGQSLNISFDGTNISSSGNIYAANITASVINTGSFVTTSSFNAYSQSTSTTITNLSASLTVTDTYLQAQINVLNPSGSAASFVALNAFTASQLNINTGYNTYTSSTNSRLNNIETTTASLNSSITQLNSSSASQQISINNLNTTTASLNSSITQLNSSSASQQISINNLNAATSSYITSAVTSSMSVATASVALNISASISTQNLQHFVTFIDNSTGKQAIYVDGGIKYNPNQDLLLVNNITSSGYISGSSLNLTGTLTASLQSGYVWAGNVSNKTTLVATSSFIIATGSFATTGSNSFNGNQTITGSLFQSSSNSITTPDGNTVGTYINNRIEIYGGNGTDAPTPRLFIGATDGRKLTLGGSFQIIDSTATTGLGASYQGFADTGSSANLNLGVYDANNGNGDTEININVDINGTTFADWNRGVSDYSNWLTLAPNTGNQPTPVMVRGLQITGSTNIQALTASLQQGYIWVGNASGKTTTIATSSLGFVSSAITASSLVTGSVNGNVLTFTKGNGTTFNLTVATGSSTTIATGSFATTGSNTFTGIQTISSSILISSSAANAITIGNGNISGPASTFIADGFQGNVVNLYNQNASVNLQLNTQYSGSQYPQFYAAVDSTIWPQDIFGGFQVQDPSIGYFTYMGAAASSYTPEYFGEVVGWIGGGGNNANGSNTAMIMKTGSANLEIYKPIVANFNLNVLGNLTASLQQGYVWVGNNSNKSILQVPTSSFGANVFPYTGSAIITGSLTITGSLSIKGNTTFTNVNGNNTNVILGLNAMTNITGTIDSSIAIGAGALRYASGSSQNTAIGANALSVTQGNNNFALGNEALTSNLTGFQNVAIGIGALNKNTSGAKNTAIGNDAGFFNTTGSQNIYLGHQSGQSISGSNNVIIGSYTGTGQTINNNIILADGAGTIKAQYSGSAWSFQDGIKLNKGTDKPCDIVSVGSTSLTVNNSLVTANSIILVTTQNGVVGVDEYPAVVTNKTNGSFVIQHNYGGTLSVGYLIINPTT